MLRKIKVQNSLRKLNLFKVKATAYTSIFGEGALDWQQQGRAQVPTREETGLESYSSWSEGEVFKAVCTNQAENSGWSKNLLHIPYACTFFTLQMLLTEPKDRKSFIPKFCAYWEESHHIKITSLKVVYLNVNFCHCFVKWKSK